MFWLLSWDVSGGSSGIVWTFLWRLNFSVLWVSDCVHCNWARLYEFILDPEFNSVLFKQHRITTTVASRINNKLRSWKSPSGDTFVILGKKMKFKKLNPAGQNFYRCDLCAVWVMVLTTWLLSEGRSTFLWGFWWAPESPWGIGRPPKQTSAFWTETASKTNIWKRNRCRHTKPQTQRSHTEKVSRSYSCSLLETGFGSLGQPYFSTHKYLNCVFWCVLTTCLLYSFTAM